MSSQKPDHLAKVFSGESTPPDEHTRRVALLEAQKMSVATLSPRAPRSNEMAKPSVRQRRKSRDQRAERNALRAVFALFLVLGGTGWWVLNSDFIKESDPAPDLAEVSPVPAAPVVMRSAAIVDETPDIPALRSMSQEGLTIVAEGIPEVTSADQGEGVAELAALETCRLAYGVWEFSANKRFRFFTTCSSLEGQILVGAYQARGTKVAMSPLTTDGPVQIVSEFEVEKPSHVRSLITTKIRDRIVVFSVDQHINTLRVGLAGPAFHDTFASKNDLDIQRGKSSGQGQGGSHSSPSPQPQPLSDMLNAPRTRRFMDTDNAAARASE